MNKLECVVTDLDGSLLNKEKKISPEDTATIKALKEKGIPVFIVTGRPFAFAKQVVSWVGFDLPACCCNGGHVYNYATGETVFSDPIPTETAKRLRAYLEEKDLPYIIYTTQRPIFRSLDMPRCQHWVKQNELFDPSNRITFYSVDDPDFDLDREVVIKFLLAYVDEDVELALNREFNQDGALSIMFSEHRVLDINAAGVDKGRGVRFLAEKYGFNLANTLALGDNYNDTAMMKEVGVPVAPANAEGELLDLAAYITTDHNDSPLTHAIRHLYPELLG